ncbi:PML-RARA-regulated adapter molecule 1 isoform X3 [Manis javanica]|uniref:PML-RARA-regulated adapter molecule 1 isoform X3 n=1 Tax=Manis javanica TaxID=9974 RepID=UPI003C6CECB6
MGSHQDFRILQAKFQASQPETSELPPKPLKPEFNKLLRKFPPPELSTHPKQPPEPELTSLLKKPSKLESSDLPKKFPQLEATLFPRKPPHPEVGEAPQQALQPELSHSTRPPPEPKFSPFPRKFQQPESNEATPKPSQPEAGTFPKKPPQPEFGMQPRKPPQPQVGSLPKKSLPQSELGEAPQTAPWKPKSCEPLPRSSQPDLSVLPKKPPQPEFNANLRKTPQPEVGTFPKKPPQPEFGVQSRKPPQPQVGGLPKKFLAQPESGEAPQTAPWKPESSEPPTHSSPPDCSAYSRKVPPPQVSDLPRKPPLLEFGDVTTSSEPEVNMFPKRPQRSDLKALSPKPLQPELGGLPRTSSEPEFGLLPRKLAQPHCRGPPRKFSQPEPSLLPKKRAHTEFLGDLPRKPPLPGSVSESSLPTAVAGSGPRFLLSPGFGARPQRSGVLSHREGSRLGLRPGRPPQRRPLPPAVSLGPPPAKPPLPPGLWDIQSFRGDSAGATALRRTCSSTGIHFQARQPADTLLDPDEFYELYDDVESTDGSSPQSRGHRDPDSMSGLPPGVPSTQQRPMPPQDPELRKEKTPQPQPLPPADPKALKQIRKAEKAEREFRKKFKFEGDIVTLTRMMIDPNAKTRRGGGKHLGIRRGEILEVIEFTNKEEMLCRDAKGKYGYVPRTALLPLETEVYDDVDFWDPLENQPFPRGQ